MAEIVGLGAKIEESRFLLEALLNSFLSCFVLACGRGNHASSHEGVFVWICFWSDGEELVELSSLLRKSRLGV